MTSRRSFKSRFLRRNDVEQALLIAIAILNFLTAIITGITLYYSRRTEINTNSMKDALVSATSRADRAEGKEEGRLEVIAVPPSSGPLPVTDSRTAAAAEQTATAATATAKATEKLADAAVVLSKGTKGENK